jgi:hypothetical protein
MARFYVGQPVVCVRGGANPNADRRYPGLRWPRKGQRYVVRCAEIPVRDKRTFVLVTRISNRIITWPCGTRYEAGFWEERFEPATDITLLENIKDFAGMQFERQQKPVKRRERKKEEVE